MSYYTNPELIGKSSSKGKRPIILHAITPNGPLCKPDPETNLPYDDLIWKGVSLIPKNAKKRQ